MDRHKRKSRIHAEMLFVEYYLTQSNNDISYPDVQISQKEFEQTMELCNDIINDYYSAWPSIIIHNNHTIGSVAVYFAWKIGDVDWIWEWAEHYGGVGNPTIYKNVEGFAESASESCRDYNVTRQNGEINIQRQ